MRDIKYRLWTGKEIIDVGSIEFMTDGSIHINEEFPINDKCFPSSYTIMQFTGLLDKNGKELYFDSDIVWLDGYGDNLFTATKDDFGIPIFIRNNNVMDAQLTFQDHFLGTLTSKRNGFEVIGNIYENKTLITPVGE